MEKKENIIDKRVLVCKILWGVVCLLVSIYFFANKDFYVTDKKINEETVQVLQYSKVILFIAATIILLAVKVIKNKLSYKWNIIMSYAWFFLLPIINYCMLEYLNKEKFKIDFWKIPYEYALLNIGLYIVILYFFYVITANIKISGILLTICNAVFGITNYYVYSFRGISIVASDIYSIKTAASVAGNYEFFIDYYIVFTIILTVLLVSISLKFKEVPKVGLKIRTIYTASFVFVAAFTIWIVTFSTILADQGMNIRLFKPQNEFKRYGTLLTTLRTTNYVLIKKPDNYSDKSAVKIEEDYIGKYAELDENSEMEIKPNIIVIMDEAFSDLTVISDEFKLEEDNMPFIRGLSEDTIKGNAYVSIYAGNTANTEFEFLTGNTMAFLPTNSVPYQLFVKEAMPNLTYDLKKQGYAGNIALHPYYPTGFSRDRVYPLFGFDKFISNQDFKGAQKLRNYITDEEDFGRIIEEYESVRSITSAPFYLFNVTMQNHGGFKKEDPALDEDRIKIVDEYVGNETVKQYVNLVKYTDDAVKGLVEYFEKIDEPTIIIFFGDHQPGLEAEFYKKLLGGDENTLDDESLMRKYFVPFFAWANYDIEEQYVEKISMNYLSSYIMQAIGLELTDYQKYLLDLYKDIPVINSMGYWDKVGEFYDINDSSSPYYEKIEEYRIIQYNNIFGKDKSNKFFYLE